MMMTYAGAKNILQNLASKDIILLILCNTKLQFKLIYTEHLVQCYNLILNRKTMEFS